MHANLLLLVGRKHVYNSVNRLYRIHGVKGSEHEVARLCRMLAVLAELGQRSYAPQMRQWVHSTDELPVAALLARHGMQVHPEPDQVAQQLGLRVKESNGLFIHQVLRGGAAEKAGFASGDEWIAIEAATGPARGPWRIHTLDELTLYGGNAKKLTCLVARDKRLLHLTLTLPKASHAVRLSMTDATLAERWLNDAAP